MDEKTKEFIKKVATKNPQVESKLIGNYIATRSVFACYCKTHDYHWTPKALTILTKGHDCKFCLVDGAGKLPAYDEEIVAYLIKKQSLGKVISLIPGTIKKVAHSPELFARWHCEIGLLHADFDSSIAYLLGTKNQSNEKRGCPICTGAKSANEESLVYQFSKSTNFEYIPNSKFKKDITWFAMFRCKLNSEHQLFPKKISDALNQMSGCPSCSQNIEINAAEAIKRIDSKVTLDVPSYLGWLNSDSIWTCSSGHVFTNSAYNVSLAEQPCFQCRTSDYSYEGIFSTLKDQGRENEIEVIKESVTTSRKEKFLWKCNKNNTHKPWPALASSVLSKRKVGCPSCAGNKLLEEDELIDYMKGRTDLAYKFGTLISSRGNKRTGIFSCLANKGHIDRTLNAKSVMQSVGCPDCSKYGYRRNREGSLYCFMIKNDLEQVVGYKWGITNRPVKTRLFTQRKHLKNLSLHFDEKLVWSDIDGNFAYEIERKLHTKFQTIYLHEIVDGRTEVFSVADFPHMLRLVEDFSKSFTSTADPREIGVYFDEKTKTWIAGIQIGIGRKNSVLKRISYLKDREIAAKVRSDLLEAYIQNKDTGVDDYIRTNFPKSKRGNRKPVVVVFASYRRWFSSLREASNFVGTGISPLLSTNRESRTVGKGDRRALSAFYSQYKAEIDSRKNGEI